MSRRFRSLAVLLLVLAAPSVVAQKDSRTALARELASLTGGTGGVTPFLLMRIAIAAEPEGPHTKQLADFEKKFADADESDAARIYATALSEGELRQLVAFFKTDAGRKFVTARTAVALSAESRAAEMIRQGLQEALETSKEKRTMADIMSLATSVEAYATDHNAYPVTTTHEALEKLLEPTYIRNLPQKDAWGNPFVYRGSSDKMSYRVVSGGPDGKIDPSSTRFGAPLRKSDDLVYENGTFLQKP